MNQMVPASLLLLLLLLCAISQGSDLAGRDLLSSVTNKKQTKLPPCKVCSLLVDSFKKGMDKTERNKHDGGDAAWEEQKLGSYKRSEIRLVEIQEMLCKELTVGEDQCHELAEANEEAIELWWFKQQDVVPDLRQWLCVEKLEVCCPFNAFGPMCAPCIDCHANGKCKGNGTRKGNGNCLCDSGYVGVDCMNCDTNGYYESYRDSAKLLCTECHHACDTNGGCTGAGPKSCRVCRTGWTMEPDRGGCVDVNECVHGPNVCHKNQFCVNSEGSYKCLECDKACSGCSGDGPDECQECADGFELRDGLCKDNSKTKSSLNNNAEVETETKNDENDQNDVDNDGDHDNDADHDEL